MNIIIAGCGKIGFELAQQLIEENHDITVIDTDAEKLTYVSSQLDVQAVQGNAAILHTLSEAGIEDTDLFIAVTGRDEINLLCCLFAKKTGNCHTIARVRNPEYFNEIEYLKEEIGLSMVINPEWAAATAIGRLIQTTSAMDLESFAKNRVNLIKITIPKKSPLHGMKLMDFGSAISTNVLICILERNHETIIPNGSIVLREDDIISLIIPPNEVTAVFKKIGIRDKAIRNIIIAGGGTIAHYVSIFLAKFNVAIKIIENNPKRCEELSSLLSDAMIIHGDASNQELLLEEGLEETDAFVALTNFDEENILLSLYSNKISKAKRFTKINKIAFEEVISELPLGTIICPKAITAEAILQHVRATQNSYGSNVETLYRIGKDVEALEFKVKHDSKVIGKPLSELNLKNNLLICCILRNRKIITPSGKDSIHAGDSVIVVTTNRGLNDLNDILM